MDSEGFIDYARKRLEETGFSVERQARFEPFGFGADLAATKTGRSLGIFFPYVDFLFFHDFNGPNMQSAGSLKSIHEKAREYVNSLFPLPRALRYRVPNIVTVAVSGNGFPVEAQHYAAERKNVPVGGERHSVFLVDLVNRRVVSQGLETTHSDMVSIRFDTVNPSNRAYHLMCVLAKGHFSGE